MWRTVKRLEEVEWVVQMRWAKWAEFSVEQSGWARRVWWVIMRVQKVEWAVPGRGRPERVEAGREVRKVGWVQQVGRVEEVGDDGRVV